VHLENTCKGHVCPSVCPCFTSETTKQSTMTLFNVKFHIQLKLDGLSFQCRVEKESDCSSLSGANVTSAQICTLTKPHAYLHCVLLTTILPLLYPKQILIGNSQI